MAGWHIADLVTLGLYFVVPSVQAIVVFLAGRVGVPQSSAHSFGS